MEDAERLTGMVIAELRTHASVQLLVRSFADGRTEQAVRLPTELLTPDGADRPDASG